MKFDLILMILCIVFVILNFICLFFPTSVAQMFINTLAIAACSAGAYLAWKNLNS